MELVVQSSSSSNSSKSRNLDVTTHLKLILATKIMSLYDLNFWRSLKTTDEILSAYENIKNQVQTALREDFSALGKVLPRWIPNDRVCLARKGYTDYQCGSCCLLDRLGANNHGGLLTLESGKQKGKRFILKELPCSCLYVHYDEKSHTLLTDEFMQRLLGTWLLELYDIPVLKLITGFICGEKGYLLYELPDRIVNGKEGREGKGGKEGREEELIAKLDKIGFRSDDPEDMFYVIGSTIKLRVPSESKFRIGPVTVRTFNYTRGKTAREILQEYKNVLHA
jgi:hypothetical protein